MNSAVNLELDLYTQNGVKRIPLNVEQPSQVELWKAELKSVLNEFTLAFDAFKKAECTLYGFIDKSSSFLSEMNCVEQVVNLWIEKICSEVSEKTSNSSHLSITPSRLPSKIRSYSFPRKDSIVSDDPEVSKGKSIFDATLEELVFYVLREYDFEGLDVELRKVTASIEEDGFKASAIGLGRAFGLIYTHSHQGEKITVKQQRGRYTLEVPHLGGWAHERYNIIEGHRVMAQTFEAESGVYGLCDCLLAAMNEEESFKGSIDEFVPSRTKVNEGMPVEAVFFNRKIKYCFKPELFEALVSFVQTYANDQIKTIEVS